MAKLEGVKVMDMVNGEITKVAYNGEEYAKVECKAEKGDLLLSEFVHLDIDEGAFYVCDSVYRNGIRLYDNNGDFRDRNHGEFKVFRKIYESTPPTIEKRVDDLEERVEALENTEETTKFKVGDYIVGKNFAPYRVTDEDMTLGIVEKSLTFPGDGICVKVLAHKTYPSKIGKTFSVESKYFRKATAEEIEEYERGKKTKPNVGECIKFTRYGEYNPLGITLNKLYKVIGEMAFLDDFGDERSHPLECTDCYEILSEEEVKFAKIGRKAGEFKKGDIVRVLGEGSGHKIKGQLGEVVEDCVDGYPLVRAVYGEDLVSLYTVVELVAPVESVLTQK